MGDIEYGNCGMCDQLATLQRRYYKYDIKCECCNRKNDNHFEIVRYCNKCKPKPPAKLKVVMKPLIIGLENTPLKSWGEKK